MKTSPHQIARRMRLAWTLGALLVLGASVLAQVRRTPDASPFIDPNPSDSTRGTFGPGGLAGIAGGVLFQGNARFFRETGTATEVDSSALILSPSTAQAVSIALGTTRYTYPLHSGLACPLGKFVRRGGEIAFTIPPDGSTEALARLKKAGAVRLSRYRNPVFAATEFATSPFVPLLEKADFADVVPLPTALETQIADNINRTSGTGPVEGRGVYVNSDAQTTYAVYLVDDRAGRGHVEISGVPLKYSWVQRRDGSFGVYKVEAFSQEWTGMPSLSAFQRTSKPTQFDVISLYQAAGMFKGLRKANASAFSAFVDAACGVRRGPARGAVSRAPARRGAGRGAVGRTK